MTKRVPRDYTLHASCSRSQNDASQAGQHCVGTSQKDIAAPETDSTVENTNSPPATHTPPSPETGYNLPDTDSQSSATAMANPYNAISAGCLRRVFAGENVVDPVVQCVQIKPMAKGPNDQERYRVVFNDTVNFIQSMIAQRESPYNRWFLNGH